MSNNPQNISEVKESFLRKGAVVILVPFVYSLIIIEYIWERTYYYAGQMIPSLLKEKFKEINGAILIAWRGPAGK